MGPRAFTCTEDPHHTQEMRCPGRRAPPPIARRARSGAGGAASLSGTSSTARERVGEAPWSAHAESRTSDFARSCSRRRARSRSSPDRERFFLVTCTTSTSEASCEPGALKSVATSSHTSCTPAARPASAQRAPPGGSLNFGRERSAAVPRILGRLRRDVPEPFLRCQWLMGTGGSFGSCTGYAPLTSGASVYSGTLAAFGSIATSFATGVDSWNTAGVATGGGGNADLPTHLQREPEHDERHPGRHRRHRVHLGGPEQLSRGGPRCCMSGDSSRTVPGQ